MFTENQKTKMFDTFQECLDSPSKNNLSLKDKKTKVKSHPPYAKMIIQAIKSEHNSEGSTLCYIKKYLETNYRIPQTSHHITKSLTQLSIKNVLIPSLDKNGNIYHKYTLNPDYKSNIIRKSIQPKVQKSVEPGLEMRGKRWSKEEDETLTKECGDNVTFTEIAIIHKRTEIGIIFRVIHLLCNEGMDIIVKLEKAGYVLEEFIEWARKRLAILGCNEEKISRLRRSNSEDKGDAKIKPTQGGNLYIIDRKHANFPTLGDFCYSEGQEYGLPKKTHSEIFHLDGEEYDKAHEDWNNDRLSKFESFLPESVPIDRSISSAMLKKNRAKKYEWESSSEESVDITIGNKLVIPKALLLKKRVAPSTNDFLRDKNGSSTDSSSFDEDGSNYSGEESESVD
jgi:hypothetical protein